MSLNATATPTLEQLEAQRAALREAEQAYAAARGEAYSALDERTLAALHSELNDITESFQYKMEQAERDATEDANGELQHAVDTYGLEIVKAAYEANDVNCEEEYDAHLDVVSLLADCN